MSAPDDTPPLVVGAWTEAEMAALQEIARKAVNTVISNSPRDISGTKIAFIAAEIVAQMVATFDSPDLCAAFVSNVIRALQAALDYATFNDDTTTDAERVH